jgi:hypothetical protein
MLLQALDKLQHEWEGAQLGVLEYRDTGTYIIKVIDHDEASSSRSQLCTDHLPACCCSCEPILCTQHLAAYMRTHTVWEDVICLWML